MTRQPFAPQTRRAAAATLAWAVLASSAVEAADTLHVAATRSSDSLPLAVAVAAGESA